MKDTCKQAILRKDTRRARRVEDPLRAGDQEERELEFFNMPGQWQLCSTHVRATFHRNSMSSSTTSSRWCKRSPPTWTPPNQNGNTFVVLQSRRDKAKVGVKRSLDSLLTPRKGPTTANTTSSPTVRAIQPTTQQQNLQIPADDDNNVTNPIEQPQTTPQTVPLLPAPQSVQLPTTARQTRSGRVVHNTPRYDQSMTQRSQGLVAWEVLMDQDEQEDIPMASTQYAIQKALEDPIAFAASDNPDILYWDQAIKAHDWDKFIKAVGIELDIHETMGNYKPIPFGKVPKGTKLIDMVWSM